MNADSESCWWLAACSVCQEGRLSPQQFQEQLQDFQRLMDNPRLRHQRALEELAGMQARYQLLPEAPFDRIPLSIADGGPQGAYLDGHQIAIAYDQNEDLYFIGTYLPSLGLEDFTWSSLEDDLGRPRSGPVHGSQQYVRCHDRQELSKAVAALPPAQTENDLP